MLALLDVLTDAEVNVSGEWDAKLWCCAKKRDVTIPHSNLHHPHHDALSLSHGQKKRKKLDLQGIEPWTTPTRLLLKRS
jgi:hypothetical protein